MLKIALLTVFLGHADRDARTGKLYNTVFVIGSDGSILGKHRKHTVVPGIESWASRNDDIHPISIPSASLKAGVLICADAYTPDVTQQLAAQGANILISPAAWGRFLMAPRLHGKTEAGKQACRFSSAIERGRIPLSTSARLRVLSS